ncbi:MAG TPA: lamin tail domain-containing protein [Candidatus Saccharimonadales bacterium]
MRRIKEILQSTGAAIVVASSLAVGLPATVQADPANTPSLVVSQLKITSSNGQFVTLYNSTDAAVDMSKYQLEYFNNYDLAKATSSKLISLSGIVPPHGYFMVNDGSLLLCYQLTVDSVSLGLSSTAGMVEVLAFNQSSPGGSVIPLLQDYVGWSKTAAAGAQTLPANQSAFFQRQPTDLHNNPAVNTAGSGSWKTVQPDGTNACNLTSATDNSGSVPTGLTQLLPAAEPPVTILSSDDGGTTATAAAAGLPAADIGLMAPTVTELLPNPAGTGNDTTDEFIELYNPNAASFDLSGFSLQVGTTALHNYKFPTGTGLPPHSFTPFYSALTGLSLSNTAGQAKLLDPFGNSISATGVYDTAKDGLSWSLANGKWYWTTRLTPGTANVINQSPPAKKAGAKTSSKSQASKPATKSKKAKTAGLTTGSSYQDQPAATPIHVWTLALVAVAALLYGAYEYRADLANRIYQLRSYFKPGRGDRA